MMKNKMILGIDMGGSNIRAGIVKDAAVANIISQKIDAKRTAEEVLQEVFDITDKLMKEEVAAIGIGFPGLAYNGIACDVYNIPSWKEVPLQALMEQRYHKPVLINNDANCFALGEFHFGKGRGYDSMIGLAIGTGLGSGIMIHKKLYTGKAGGAGEFGMMPYLDKFYEYYASGQFFQNIYGVNGEAVFKNAIQGDAAAIRMYEEFGRHLGNAIIAILYAMDTALIVLGGSVSNAFELFSKTMWEQIQNFELKKGLQGLQVEVSALDNSAILGAAALHYALD